MKRILVVCMGNICRSPLAEGVLRTRAAEAELDLFIDSAGTHSYHTGEPPDPRAIAAAARRGIDISTLRARTVVESDFDNFDHIIAMDRDNLALLNELASTNVLAQLHLFRAFCDEPDADVPDPYYGGDAAFERALDLVERAAQGLINSIK